MEKKHQNSLEKDTKETHFEAEFFYEVVVHKTFLHFTEPPTTWLQG